MKLLITCLIILVWNKQSGVLLLLEKLSNKVLVYLYGEYHKSNADHSNNKKLGGPCFRSDIPKAHSRKCHNAEIKGVKEIEFLANSFQMLNSTNAKKADMNYYWHSNIGHIIFYCSLKTKIHFINNSKNLLLLTLEK